MTDWATVGGAHGDAKNQPGDDWADCLGYALAMPGMKLALATLPSQWQFVLVEKKPVKLQRRGFTLAPKGGVRMVMTGKR